MVSTYLVVKRDGVDVCANLEAQVSRQLDDWVLPAIKSSVLLTEEEMELADERVAEFLLFHTHV